MLWLLALIGAAAAAYQFGAFDSLIETEGPEPILGAEVRRGPLRISEVVRGNLEAKDSIVLKSQIQGRSTIIYLAEEGSVVKAGDLVAELDVSQLEDDLVRREIEVKNAEAAYTKAKEQYDIQVIQNISDIEAAELALELAELDLARYTGDAPLDEVTSESMVSPDAETPEEATQIGEWDNELAKAKDNVLLKDEALARATRDLEASQMLFEREFIPENDLRADELAEKSAKIQLEQAQRELELLQRFGNRRRLAELNSNVATCKRDIEKTRKQAAARLTDFEAARESARYKLERERQQLAELRGQVDKSKIFAPEEGLLVYARERSRWGSGDSIEEGDEVRERQDIASIPRAGGMTVKASIHETKLKKVQVGQTCTVTIDAFPDRTFEGRVDFVAVMADSGSWRSNPNQRLYKADIALVNPTREMRPGMSASVEILVEDLSDVHYVPRQCVFLDGTDTVCFRVVDKESGELERVAVDVGLDNTKYVAILSGLSEGDTVALSPPADFQPKTVTDDPDGGGPPAGAGAEGEAKGGRPSGKGRPAGRPSGEGRPGSGRGGKRPGGGPSSESADAGASASKSGAKAAAAAKRPAAPAAKTPSPAAGQ